MGLTPVYVCVHVPEFAAQAILRLRPELGRQAVAIMAGEPPLEQVCSLNRVAARLGVEHGMTRAELDSLPGATALRRSVPEERSARDALVEAATSFTHRLEVQPARGAALDLVLEMTGTERLFGPVEQCAATIRRALHELHFAARVAASANLHTAICLAPTAHRPVIVPAGEERQALHRLPLSALALAPEHARALELWGLRTLGELAALPEVELIARLGQAGKRLRQLACGEHPHLMVPEEPACAPAEYVAFDAPVELLDSLLFVLGPMVDQLLARARLRALALASVTVTLGLEGGGVHTRVVKPALPVAERSVLLRLLHLDLQAHPPAAGVLSIRAEAEQGRQSTVQTGLFTPHTPEAMRLDVTLARIAALVGETQVGRACLTDTHAEDGFVMERFRVPDAPAPPPERVPVTHVAMRCCRPPVPLRMSVQDARPAAFFYEGSRFAVQQAYGPWRKSGNWWSASVWSFDEWDVCAATASGDTLLCVVAHDLLRHRWQLKALYD